MQTRGHTTPPEAQDLVLPFRGPARIPWFLHYSTLPRERSMRDQQEGNTPSCSQAAVTSPGYCTQPPAVNAQLVNCDDNDLPQNGDVAAP